MKVDLDREILFLPSQGLYFYTSPITLLHLRGIVCLNVELIFLIGIIYFNGYFG